MSHIKSSVKKLFTWCLKASLLLMLQSCQTTMWTTKESKNKTTAPQYWLTTSMYAGRFYDNEKMYLIDYRPFSALNEVETKDGYILYPPPALKTIPAGTLVRVKGIDYPDEASKLKRPIFSPRDAIWVYLEVAKERGEVSLFHEKTHVLVLPKNITTEKEIRSYLSKFLSNTNPNLWLLPLPSALQLGIFEKRPVFGMNKEQLTAALGPALKKQYQKNMQFEDPQEIWYFHNYLVTIKDNLVYSVKEISKGLDNDKKILPY